jgi:hypothetical protein
MQSNDTQRQMPYSLKQAADATGRQKTTILRAIQRGKISASKDEHGEWEIDPAELHRVYDPASAASSETEQVHAAISSSADAATHREIALLREMLADKNAVIEDLREDRDRWRTQAEKLLLTDQRGKAPDVMVTPPPTSAAIITPPAAAPSPSAPARGDGAPAAVKVRAVKKPPAKEASWFWRMMGGR